MGKAGLEHMAAEKITFCQSVPDLHGRPLSDPLRLWPRFRRLRGGWCLLFFALAGGGLYSQFYALVAASAGWLPIALLCLAVMGIVAFWFHRYFTIVRLHRLGLSRFPDPRDRLCFAGAPDSLLKHGELNEDVSFEPRVFVARISMSLCAASFHFGGTLAILMSFMQFLRSGDIVMTAWLFLFLVPCLVGLIPKPAYLRIVPGKLEVLQFSSFGNRRTTNREHDLRNARILIDNVRGCIQIENGDQVYRYDTAFVLEKSLLAHALFQAALSTHESGPLPADALLG